MTFIQKFSILSQPGYIIKKLWTAIWLGRLLYASDLYYAEGFYDKADAYLDSVKMVWNSIGENRKINYYSSSMQLKADKGDFTGLQEDLNEYVNFDNEKIFWHDAVYNHVLLGQYAEAADALAQYRKYNSNYRDDPAYYLVSSYLYKSSENFKAALENFEIYSDLSDSLSLVIAEQDTGFIKERYEKELQIERAKNTRNIIITVSAIFLLLIVRFLTIYVKSLRPGIMRFVYSEKIILIWRKKKQLWQKSFLIILRLTANQCKY